MQIAMTFRDAVDIEAAVYLVFAASIVNVANNTISKIIFRVIPILIALSIAATTITPLVVPR